MTRGYLPRHYTWLMPYAFSCLQIVEKAHHMQCGLVRLHVTSNALGTIISLSTMGFSPQVEIQGLLINCFRQPQ